MASTATSSTRPILPERLRSSPWLVFARPPMDYFSLPLHPSSPYCASPEAEVGDEISSSPVSEASTSTTSSQRSFYDNSFNYLNYRSGLELPSPSFGLEEYAAETEFIEDVNDDLLSPTSTVSSSLTLADDHLADQSSFSPTFLYTHSSSSSEHLEHGFPITPPTKPFTLTLPPSRRFNKAHPQPHLLEFRSLSGVPSRPLKEEIDEVHADTPYPTEEEEENQQRGRGLERRGGWLGNGFELRLGGDGIASRRS